MARAELTERMSRVYPVDGDHPLVPALKATFDSARAFGLSEVELWATVEHALSGAAPGEDPSEYVDRLHAELASAILAKAGMRYSALR